MSNFFSLNLPESAIIHRSLSSDGAFQPSALESPEDDDNEIFRNGPWHRGEQITLSFAEDGTEILGRDSKLFSSFAWMLNEQQLQERILQAFQVWARTTNLNVGMVSDGGQAFGSPGLEQHDLRFGDIRVGAIDMPADVFGVAIPADDLAAGTWAGEVIFNSAADFSGPRQFYQVALHEAGHVLGLGHSDQPASPMFLGGDSIKITPADVSKLRKLYGNRNLDFNESRSDKNDSFHRATELEYRDGGDDRGKIPLVAFGDLANGDSDFFEVKLPSDYQGRLSFRVDTSGLSVLSPTVSVYDEDGRLLRHRKSTSKTGDEIVLSLPSTDRGGGYFVKVASNAGDGVFGIGSYVVGATLNDLNTMGWNKIREFVDSGLYNLEEQEDFQEALLDPEALLNEDAGTNDSFTAAQAIDSASGFAEQSRYEIQGSISSVNDVDFFKLSTTKEGLHGLTNMVVRIDSVEDSGLIPKVDVYDEDHNRVRSAVLVNANGQLSIQAKNLAIDSEYFVRVDSSGVSPNFETGNYRMSVDFSDNQIGFRKFAAGEILAGEVAKDHSLYVAESQILHINLLSQYHPEVSDAVIWLTVYDEEGNVTYRSATQPGQTRSANSILFSPGSYAVKVELALPDGVSSSTPFNYLVRGRQISNSQGPKLLDTTESPFDQCNAGSPEYCYPNGNHSTVPYIFVNAGDVAVDPPTTPWVDVNNWYWFDNWLTDEVPPNL